ncbi:MAG TPA: M36 family metallopeptidase [Pyrinomonadaceae bacterium]|nr:M36 family metallopeptidase [Pyrinomonadaceae bacterium]
MKAYVNGTRVQYFSLARKVKGRRALTALLALALAALLTGPQFINSAPPARAAGSNPAYVDLDGHEKRVPDIHASAALVTPRAPSAAQLRALDDLKANLNDRSVTARWDQATGSVDVVYDFATAPSSLEPEAAARAFVESNAALFGITDAGALRLKSNVEALGGNLLYFDQVHNGLTVVGGGVGVVMDGQRRVRMVSGPYYSGLSLDTTPTLDGAAAVAAARADLASYGIEWTSTVASVMNPAMDVLEAQLGVLATPRPELNIVPTHDGARLAYGFYVFSRNPFGYYHYQIDAATGEVLARADQVNYQQPNPLPYTADIYPSSPVIANPDTAELALDEKGEPKGMLRVQLRNYNPGMHVGAVSGTYAGPNALVYNVLATKLPFAQAALGTFHFRQNNLPLEAQPNEQDDLAEPAQHIDGVNNFFFINYLMEYIKHVHIASDRQHAPFGQGHFPDSFPNSDKPLVGIVHFPSDHGQLNLSGPTDTSSPEAALRSSLGMDNAFSLSTTQTVAGQTIVVNPTAYGHGYASNDFAKDGPVVYHEGMHSISTPIAGLRAAPEGGALNEGQADCWAYSITNDKVLGNYIVNAPIRRARTRATGVDPDLRQWIRNADSGLTYTRLGTSGAGGNAYQVHRDGEIYAATMIDIRELMHLYQKGGAFKRPNFLNGAIDVSIPLAQETWERLLLGQIYVLGTMEPDTFVRARDAMIVADAFLYPTDALDPDAPGQHRALIEQVFAAHEIGKNAVAPANASSPQTVSTEVSAFAASQPKLAATAGVTVTLESPSANRVSWQPVQGALGYEVLKREIGREGQRLNRPVSTRPYREGDSQVDGYLHVDYVSADQTSYVDSGFIESGFVRRGLNNPAAFEYVVRTLSVNPNKQLGVSDKSAAARAPFAVTDVSESVEKINSNYSLAGGKLEFDQVLRNLGAGAFDGTIYEPVEFRINSISDSTVTVANAENGGTGKPGSPALFYYRQKLLKGQTSAPRRLSFNAPRSQLFTFDAVITALVQTAPGGGATGQQQTSSTQSTGGGSTGGSSLTGLTSGGTLSSGSTVTRVVRYTVNPLSGTVTTQLIK